MKTRPAGPMAIQLCTKNIKKLESANYTFCICPHFQLFRSISYHCQDKYILHTMLDLEILSRNYEKAHLLNMCNIASKFAKATP